MKKVWFIPVLVLTVVCVLVYVISQQILRESANDPQIRMAEDIASALTKGKQPADFNTLDKIDIRASLSPYTVIYDLRMKPVASSGQLDGSVPVLPSGVFDSAKKLEDRISWKPKSNVRSALVVVSYPGGWVAVGRSLREIEIRVANMLKIIGTFWLISVVFILGITLVKKRVSQAIA